MSARRNLVLPLLLAPKYAQIRRWRSALRVRVSSASLFHGRRFGGVRGRLRCCDLHFSPAMVAVAATKHAHHQPLIQGRRESETLSQIVFERPCPFRHPSPKLRHPTQQVAYATDSFADSGMWLLGLPRMLDVRHRVRLIWGHYSGGGTTAYERQQDYNEAARSYGADQ